VVVFIEITVPFLKKKRNRQVKDGIPFEFLGFETKGKSLFYRKTPILPIS